MSQIVDILSTENELFRIYSFYCCVLVLKMLLMGILTGHQRFKHQAFANSEDAGFLKLKIQVNENVERVRRAHLNDVENIPIFILASFVFILTNPTVSTATLLFRLFAGARIIYTVVYAVWVIPQPARALAYAVGELTTAYMAVRGILHFM